MIVDELNL